MSFHNKIEREGEEKGRREGERGREGGREGGRGRREGGEGDLHVYVHVPCALKNSSAASVAFSVDPDHSGWRVRNSHWTEGGREGGKESREG